MYRWMILLSLVAGLLTAALTMKRRNVPGNYILMSVFLNVLLILFGGIASTYFLSSGGETGLTSTGGAVGMLMGALIFSVITPQYRRDFFCSYILALPLMYGISKIGCTFAGCCAGMHYEGPFAITGIHGGSVFPIQILEVIVFLIVFAVSLFLELKDKFRPFAAAIIYALIKILLDFLRDTHKIDVFSPNQYLCFMVIILCLFLKLIKSDINSREF